MSKLLFNYHAIQGMLYGKSPSLHDVYVEQNETPSYGTKRHATSVISGKERARQKEELFCMMIDLDDGLERCSETVREALRGHYITEQKLIAKEERGKLFFCIRQLTRHMNNTDEPQRQAS